MTTIINANTSSGLVQTADTSGIVKVQSNGTTTNAIAWASYNYINAGVTPTVRSAYNVSSITRNSAGNFTFAFTTALSDANYAFVGVPNFSSSQTMNIVTLTKTTTSVNVLTGYVSGTAGQQTLYDFGIDFLVFGN